MNHYYSIIALDIARDRAAEAARDRRAHLMTTMAADRPNIVRRGLANGLALVSRGSAAAARRLDDGRADDLQQALTAAK